jgi:hypothetical protein
MGFRSWLRAQERARSGGWGGGAGLVRREIKTESGRFALLVPPPSALREFDP